MGAFLSEKDLHYVTVRTDRPYGPSVRTVRTDRPYGPSVQTVRTDRPYGTHTFKHVFCFAGSALKRFDLQNLNGV